MTIKLKKIIKRGVGIKPYTSRLYYILYMYFIFIFRVFLWHVDMIANAYHLLVVLIFFLCKIQTNASFCFNLC
jgi:hypothetical protein